MQCPAGRWDAPAAVLWVADVLRPVQTPKKMSTSVLVDNESMATTMKRRMNRGSGVCLSYQLDLVLFAHPSWS